MNEKQRTIIAPYTWITIVTNRKQCACRQITINEPPLILCSIIRGNKLIRWHQTNKIEKRNQLKSIPTYAIEHRAWSLTTSKLIIWRGRRQRWKPVKQASYAWARRWACRTTSENYAWNRKFLSQTLPAIAARARDASGNYRKRSLKCLRKSSSENINTEIMLIPTKKQH